MEELVWAIFQWALFISAGYISGNHIRIYLNNLRTRNGRKKTYISYFVSLTLLLVISAGIGELSRYREQNIIETIFCVAITLLVFYLSVRGNKNKNSAF